MPDFYSRDYPFAISIFSSCTRTKREGKARSGIKFYLRLELVVSWTNDSAAVFREEPESKVWGERQESIAATWWTQDTVQRGAQAFFVKNSRWRCSSVYCISGIPG